MEFVIAFLVFLLVIVFMALGVLFCDCEEVCDDHRTLYQIKEPSQ